MKENILIPGEENGYLFSIGGQDRYPVERINF